MADTSLGINKITAPSIVGVSPDASVLSSMLPSLPSKTIPSNTPTVPLTFRPPANSVAPSATPTANKTKYNILTVFPATIELDELSIPHDKTTKPGKPENVYSVEFPLIKVNDYIFSRDEILNFQLDCTEFLPTISLELGFIDNLFLSKNMPKDGDIISIAIRNRSDTLKIVRNDYVITGVISRPNQSQTKAPILMTLYGELYVPGLSSQMGDWAFDGTTMEALKDVAQRLKLGFATNEDNTDDKQVWLKANIATDIFIQQLVERSWKDQESFYNAWIDVYYNLCFVNLNKQLMSAESEIEPAVLLSNMDTNTTHETDMSDKATNVTPKIFSNINQFRATPFFINTWKPKNRATAVTFQVGTKMTCEMFEHNAHLFEKDDAQNYWAIPVEPIYDKDKLRNNIILRGRTVPKDPSMNIGLQLANNPFMGVYEKYPWLGIQYTASDTSVPPTQRDGNHHKNYQVAKVNNLMNLKELDKLNVYVAVNGNNMNVIVGDKIPILIIRTDAADNKRVNKKNPGGDVADLFFSGWYIVKGYTLSWSSEDNDKIVNNFVHEFVLTRREWPAPVPIDGIPDPVTPAASSGTTLTEKAPEQYAPVNPKETGLLNPIGKKVTLSSRFGPRKSPTKGASSNHKGVDFAVPSGTPIYSPGDGMIKYAGDTSPNSCGGKITISTGQYVVTMCHVRQWIVSTGQNVKRGQLVGYTGGGEGDAYAGASTGAHLHYAVTMGGKPYNPEVAHSDLGTMYKPAVANNPMYRYFSDNTFVT